MDALWALSYLSEQGDEEIEGVLAEDLLPVIVRHLESERSKMVVPALRASGNIVSGNDAQVWRFGCRSQRLWKEYLGICLKDRIGLDSRLYSVCVYLKD